jgi:hypothetical protein
VGLGEEDAGKLECEELRHMLDFPEVLALNAFRKYGVCLQ